MNNRNWKNDLDKQIIKALNDNSKVNLADFIILERLHYNRYFFYQNALKNKKAIYFFMFSIILIKYCNLIKNIFIYRLEKLTIHYKIFLKAKV